MRIAIVGCGVGGMAAGLALARDGHEVTVFEKFDAPRPLGAGLLLQPSGLAALDALGLRAEVEASGARIHALRGKTARGRLVLDLVYERWRTGAYGLGLHRAALFGALQRALANSGTVVRTATDIVRVEDFARPSLIDAGGAAHGPFDAAVMADGAFSSMRARIAPAARAPLYPWGAIWTIRPDPDDRWAGILAQTYAGARVMIGVLPVGAAPDAAGPHVAFFWSLREDDHAAWKSAGLEGWRTQVRSYWPDAARLLDGPLDFAALPFARYRDVRAWPWGAGATVLLGDAAHATSPQLGQGANLALADAVALAAALKRAAPSRALAEYRRARAANVAWVQMLSAALTPVFQSRSTFIGWARDQLLLPVSRLWPFDRMMLATLTGAGAMPLAHLRALWPWPRRIRPDRPSAPRAPPPG